MLLSHGLRAIQIALAAACLYVGYVGVSPILSTVSVAETRLPPATAPPERALAFEPYRVIETRNLFRSANPVVEIAAPAQEEIKETRLKLRLLGTAATVPEEFSLAVIEDLTKRERVAVGLGDKIAGTATVKRIERGRVVVDNKGALESISMDDEAAANPVDPAQARREAQRRRVSERRARSRAARGRSAAARAAEMAASPQNKSIDRLGAVMQGARLQPHFDEGGQFGGVKLSGIKSGGPFDGMEEDTVCFEINDQPIKAIQEFPTAVRNGAEGETCLRCRTPDGAETTRCI